MEAEETMPDNQLSQEQILARLTSALQGTLTTTTSQIDDLKHMVEQLRRDMISMQSELRNELRTQFVTRQEYDPRHSILESRQAVFDQHVKDSEAESRQFAVTQVEVKQLQEDVSTIDSRLRGWTKNIFSIIAVVISSLSVLLYFLSHVQFR